MAAKTTRKVCDTCTHCQATRFEGMVVETVCRRFPPVVIMDGRSSAFPLVLDDDTCGEYAPRK